MVTEGLVEEVVLGREFQAVGRASAKALGQPVLSSLAFFMKAGTISYCLLSPEPGRVHIIGTPVVICGANTSFSVS